MSLQFLGSDTLSWHSTASRCTQIPELLRTIMSFMSRGSLFRAICVSKHWAEIGLDILWRCVYDLRHLLKILAPLVSVKGSRRTSMPPGRHIFYKFERPLTSRDWSRFHHYAQRVHHLYLDQRSWDSTRKPIYIAEESVLDEMIAACPTAHVLPELQSLTWHAVSHERQLGLLSLIHGKIQRMSLQVHCTVPDPLAWIHYVEQLTKKASQTTDLCLELSAPARECEDQIIALIRGLPALRHVVLHPYCLTTNIVTALSRLEHVTEIASRLTILGNSCSHGDRMDVMHFAPEIHSEVYDAFPQLQKLTFSAQVEHAELFVRQLVGIDLRYLCIHIIAESTPESLRQLFVAISANLKSLTELHINYIPPPPILPSAYLQGHEPTPSQSSEFLARPSINTFRPLFARKTITTFEFRWNVPLDLSQVGVEEFASSWSQLEVLLLNCEPLETIKSMDGLPMQAALTAFARHCPNLKQLGLFLNATDVRSSLVPSGNTMIQPFANLERLIVAASPIDDAEPVTLFLSRMCPLGCEVDADAHWPPKVDDRPLDEHHQDTAGEANRDGRSGFGMRAGVRQWMRWREVGKMLRIATMARIDERKRLGVLRF